MLPTKDTFIKKILEDVDGVASSKRLITFLFSLSFIFVFVYATIKGITPDKVMVESISYIIIAGLAATASEKFTSGRT